MRKIFWTVLVLFFFSCESKEKVKKDLDPADLDLIISSVERDGRDMMEEIAFVSEFITSLYENQDTVDFEVPLSYTFTNGISNNRPGDSDDKSTIYISSLQTDQELIYKEIRITNPLDSLFRSIRTKYPQIAQIYTNSADQISRVYPEYDAVNLLEPDLDLTAFNFYYGADETNNPERVPRWLPDAYIDPAGLGWIVSLVSPVYVNDQLKLVVGIDFKLSEILEPYMRPSAGEFLVVTAKGDIVSGSPVAINALGFPPLKNHVYTETIKTDNFRISDYNLYNSKSAEVRKMASTLLNFGEDRFYFEQEPDLCCAIVSRFQLIGWVLIEIVKN
ncbi:hypothetical protein [Algoriphagus sediminis]|uniref:DUF4249 family protein n=1 Tax=Algoriphagus sediminis TaxID=3057113 RepID=A0ABT7YAI5_9BACT|nr:hypothetical protein [Algoriphagus sediminis]MDN3203521.1 hypothetical protein [Algoriphagus sediminis]